MTSILITGGTGSFGQRFARFCLSEWGYDRIAIYSRSEHAQEAMQRKFDRYDYPPQPAMRYFIGDVRDRDRLAMAMRGVETVVHAAALKVVPMMESNPSEAVQTNVLGTMNVMHAALEAGVSKVVLLSTDKCALPHNLYGATKMVAEKMFTSAAKVYSGRSGPSFVIVRYGNIAGSQGSVIPLWRSTEGPVTVTDPEATRYWMTLDEAANLVRFAILHAHNGETIIPELPRFKVGELAEAMGREARIIGMRPGEKLHETIITEYEAPNFYPMDGHVPEIGSGQLFIGNPSPLSEYEPDPVYPSMQSSDGPHMTVGQIRDALRDLDRETENAAI